MSPVPAPGTGTAYAVAQTQVGLAIESVRGTPVAPTWWIPVKSPKYKIDQGMIDDQSLQGSMVEVYDTVRGLRYDSHGWTQAPYLDSLPLLMRALLGSTDTVTAAPANTTLAAAATVGSSTISTTATIPAGSYIVLGSGYGIETHLTTAVSGTGPYTVTLAYPLSYAQASGSAVTGLTKHQVGLLNNGGPGDQPPSVTITDFDGERTRQLAAAQLSKFDIKVTPTGLVEATTEWFANAATSPAGPTPSFTQTQAPPGWSGQMSVGGSQVTYYTDAEISLDRKVKPIPTVSANGAYFAYFASPLSLSIKFTVVEQAGAPELTSFANGTTTSFDLTVADVSSGFAANFHSSRARFKMGELDRGKDWVEAQVTLQPLPSATDATSGGTSPMVVTVANATTTAY